MVDAKLTNLPSLANALAQVVQLGAADLAATTNNDINDVGRMIKEGSLDAFVGHDAANGELLVHAATATGNDDSVEDLHALLLSFDNAAVYVHGVADVELGQFRFER